MVNQLTLSFERDRIIMSPYDEVLKKQLTDYEVKVTENGTPKYSSENEHFVDALGLAHLAMVLEFKNLTGIVEEVRATSNFHISKNHIGGPGLSASNVSRPHLDNRVANFYANND